MDTSIILHKLIGTLWVIIPALFVAPVFKSAWFKGVFGEFLINTSAWLFLPKTKYHLFRNVTLPTEDGTTQIDQIIVSRYGVFVIETKNMKGWIFGSATQKTWTQKIYRRTYKFQNPLHQNYKHVKTLEAFLGVPPTAIHSLVVFVGDSTFKTAMPDNVTYAGRYVQFIKSKQGLLLSQADVATAIETIQSHRFQPGLATHRQHLRNVHAQQATNAEMNTRTTPAEAPECTKCGGNMRLRTVRKGKHAGEAFWGCEAFPACRGMRALD